MEDHGRKGTYRNSVNRRYPRLFTLVVKRLVVPMIQILLLGLQSKKIRTECVMQYGKRTSLSLTAIVVAKSLSFSVTEISAVESFSQLKST